MARQEPREEGGTAADFVRSLRAQDEPTLGTEDYAEFVRDKRARMEAADALNASALGQAGLGDESLPVWTRFRMAQGANVTEKTNALTSSFPDAQLVVGEDNELLFRTEPAKPFSRVDPNMMERFEPLTDIVEFVGADIGALLGETAATFMTRGTNLIPLVARMAAGAAAGKAAQEALQWAMGDQAQNIGEIGRDSLVSSGLAAGGGFVAAPIVGMVNSFRGAGMVRTSAMGDRALVAERELGMEARLSVGQVSDNPVIQKMQGQSAALLAAFPRRFEAQRQELVQRVSTAADRREVAKFTTEVRDAVYNMEGDLIAAARRAPTTATEAGEQVQEGIQTFLRDSQTSVSASYRAAESIEEPVFDLVDVDGVAESVLAGAFGTPTATSNTLAKELTALIETPGSIGGVSYTQRLRNLRSDAFAAKTPEPGFPFMAEHRQASEFYNAIDGVLKNPRNTSPEFRDAWLKANQAASARFSTVDKLVLIRASASETSEDLARRLVTPRSAERLAFARSVIGPERFGRIQESFANDLLDSGLDMPSQLARYDQQTLDILMPRSSQRAFKDLSFELNRLNDLGVQDALRKQAKVHGFVNDVLNRSDTAAVDTLTQLVRRNGGKAGPLGMTVRAAVLDLFSQRVIARSGGRGVVSPDLVNRTIQDFTKTGMFRFLELSDLRFVRNVDAIAPIIQQTADSGTSLQAGEAVAGLRGLSASAARTLIEAVGAGRAFLSPGGRRILLGIGGRERMGRSADAVILTGAALSQAMLTDNFQDLEEVEQQ